MGTHEQISQAIAIDISSRRHASANPFAAQFRVDHKTTCAIDHRRQIHRLCARLAKHHVTAASIHSGCWVGTKSPHNQIRQTISVHIACR